MYIYSHFYETIYIYIYINNNILTSQELISLAYFQLMDGTLKSTSHPIYRNKHCALVLLI